MMSAALCTTKTISDTINLITSISPVVRPHLRSDWNRFRGSGDLKRRINQGRPFEDRAYIKQEGIDFDPRLLLIQPQRTLHLEGYWQSEGYFKDVEATIRQELQIKPPTDAVNLAMAERIRSHIAVAVHVRFFDEPQAIGINNAPSDYYSRAIAEMERRAPNAHYYLFSDRPEAARARIPLPRPA